MGAMRTKNELAVIMKAKELCSVVFDVTEKSPKRYRFTFSSKLQNYALDVIDRLCRANEIFAVCGEESAKERLALQREALSELKLLSCVAEIAKERGALLPKQYERVTRLACDCANMTAAWAKSDAKRLKAAAEKPSS